MAIKALYNILRLIPLLPCILYLATSGIMYGQSFPERLVLKAKSFLGASYQSGPLDQQSIEIIETNPAKFDCVTFVEHVVASEMHEGVALHSTALRDKLIMLRYRDGILGDYGSRLHYFSEWLLQAEKNGLGKNVSLELNGQERLKNIFFMTHNLKNYPRINSPDILEKIQKSEAFLSNQAIPYVPKENIGRSLPMLQAGDLIALTSSREGLDIHHVGFIAFKNNRPYLIHASPVQKKVCYTRQPLDVYVNHSKNTDGIIIFRWSQDVK